jgi:hypothetical protein
VKADTTGNPRVPSTRTRRSAKSYIARASGAAVVATLRTTTKTIGSLSRLVAAFSRDLHAGSAA